MLTPLSFNNGAMVTLSQSAQQAQTLQTLIIQLRQLYQSPIIVLENYLDGQHPQSEMAHYLLSVGQDWLRQVLAYQGYSLRELRWQSGPHGLAIIAVTAALNKTATDELMTHIKQHYLGQLWRFVVYLNQADESQVCTYQPERLSLSAAVKRIENYRLYCLTVGSSC